MIFNRLSLVSSCLTLSLIFSISIKANEVKASVEAKSSQPDNHWLTHAENDQQRFERIEIYLRGFDQPMWEVGERFTKMTAAVDRSNYGLAIYHWEKIRKTIVNGLMKRPGRSANAEVMLLDSNWQDVMDQLNKHDKQSGEKGLNKAAMVCMACHGAEKVGFVNDQPMFDRFNK